MEPILLAIAALLLLTAVVLVWAYILDRCAEDADHMAAALNPEPPTNVHEISPFGSGAHTGTWDDVTWSTDPPETKP